MRRMMFLLLITLFMTTLCTTRLAMAQEESEEEAKFSPEIAGVMNVGFTGVLSPHDGWVGQYVYFGPSLFIHFHENMALILVGIFEAGPGTGYWGFTVSTIFEIIPPNSPIAIDIVPTVGTDTAPDLATKVFWAVGPGFTVALPKGVTVGGAFQVSGFFDHAEEGVFFFPVFNLGTPLP